MCLNNVFLLSHTCFHALANIYLHQRLAILGIGLHFDLTSKLLEHRLAYSYADFSSLTALAEVKIHSDHSGEKSNR